MAKRAPGTGRRGYRFPLGPSAREPHLIYIYIYMRDRCALRAHLVTSPRGSARTDDRKTQQREGEQNYRREREIDRNCFGFWGASGLTSSFFEHLGSFCMGASGGGTSLGFQELPRCLFRASGKLPEWHVRKLTLLLGPRTFASGTYAKLLPGSP